MKITLFVKPESLNRFVEVMQTLKDLPLESSYRIEEYWEIVYSLEMVSNYVWITVDMADFAKFGYYMTKSKA